MWERDRDRDRDRDIENPCRAYLEKDAHKKMSTGRWMDKEDVVHIYNGILLNIKKNEIMWFAATQMDLEIIVLN